MNQKEFMLMAFEKDTCAMAIALVYSDDWGYHYHSGGCGYECTCDSEEEAIDKEIAWLESERVEPEPQPAPDMKAEIEKAVKAYAEHNGKE